MDLEGFTDGLVEEKYTWTVHETKNRLTMKTANPLKSLWRP